MFVKCCPDLLTDCALDWLLKWINDWLFDWYWLIDWLIVWLFVLLVDWLICRFVDIIKYTIKLAPGKHFVGYCKVSIALLRTFSRSFFIYWHFANWCGLFFTWQALILCSLVKIQYSGEHPCPRGSVLDLRPPGPEFRILCLEGSVISFISPSSGGSPGPV